MRDVTSPFDSSFGVPNASELVRVRLLSERGQPLNNGLGGPVDSAAACRKGEGRSRGREKPPLAPSDKT